MNASIEIIAAGQRLAAEVLDFTTTLKDQLVGNEGFLQNFPQVSFRRLRKVSRIMFFCAKP